MELDIRERVHVMPVGYEHERIIHPAVHYRADRVVLIGHEDNDRYGSQCWKDVKNSLNKERIEYDEKTCDLFDLYSALGTIAESISQYDDDDVYVNVASGSKITAIGGMIASMVMDATAYYVKAGKYTTSSDFQQVPPPKDVENVSELPTYPMDAPDVEEVVTLEYISRVSNVNGPPTKGDIIRFSENIGLRYISRDVSEKGKYRVVDSYMLRPLREKGYLEETKNGRNRILRLTPDGRAALEAFRWMVNSDIAWEDYISPEDPEQG